MDVGGLVVSAGARVAHGVTRWAVRHYQAAVHLVRSAVHVVARAATATVAFVKHHAAAIASIVVSVAVFAGCEAVLTGISGGALSVPGAVACGAPSWIVSVYQAAEPRAVEDPNGVREVIAVGSDGGGGLFVSLRSRDSPIYLLPPSRIRGGNYLPLQGVPLGNLKVADTFDGFLEEIISRLEETVRG